MRRTTYRPLPFPRSGDLARWGLPVLGASTAPLYCGLSWEEVCPLLGTGEPARGWGIYRGGDDSRRRESSRKGEVSLMNFPEEEETSRENEGDEFLLYRPPCIAQLG